MQSALSRRASVRSITIVWVSFLMIISLLGINPNVSTSAEYSFTVMGGQTLVAKSAVVGTSRLAAVSAGYNSVKLTWSKALGASRYAIYRSTSKNGTYSRIKTITSGSTLSYTNKGLTTGKKYYYKVRAYRVVSGKNVYGSYSNVKSATPVPVKPMLTVVSAGYNSVKLTWSKVLGASRYAIYRSTSKNGTYSRIKTITSGSTLSYTNKGLTTGKRYYYKVRAYRVVSGKNIYGSYSYVKSATPVPAKPTLTAVSAGYDSVKLTWSKVSGVSRYAIYRSTSKNGTYSRIKTITSGSTLKYTNTGLTTGKRYYYKVRAYRVVSGKNVYGSYSYVKSATPAPAKPTLTVVSAGYDSVKLTWSKVSGASRYEIYRSTSKNGTYSLIKTITSCSMLNYANTGLIPGKKYYYKVRAYHLEGSTKVYGSFSSVVSQNNPDYRQAMRQWVIDISLIAKEYNSDFLIIPQNCTPLFTYSGSADGKLVTDFLSSIDGIGIEGLSYGGMTYNEARDESEKDELVELLNVGKQNGVDVLVVDYCSDKSKIEESLEFNREHGYISFIAENMALTDLSDGVINTDNNDVSSINDAENWLILLNLEKYESKESYLKDLSDSDYDVIVIDAFIDMNEMLTYDDVNMLKTKKDGTKRIVIAYLSIGEAEDYRYYWKEEYDDNLPSWILWENPQWEGNYPVKYWDEEWQGIIAKDEDSYLKRILNVGFDGVYLDIVDAYQTFENMD